MIKTAKSHIENVRKQHSSTAELVKVLLNWSTEEYNEFQYVAGINYAHHITGGDEMGFDMLVTTKYYWAWWRNEWAKRDADFITDNANKTNMIMLHQEYTFNHTDALHIGKMAEIMEKMGVYVMGYAIDEVMKGGVNG